MYYFVMAADSKITGRFADAVVVYANFAKFNGGQRVRFPCVESRMVLWCKEGRGTVTVNGHECELEAGRYLVLPWKHAIRYRADRDEPFLLGGVHIVPAHRRDRPVTFDVAHDGRHRLAGAAFRRDRPIPGLSGVRQGWLQTNAVLSHLLEYTAHLFGRGRPPQWLARQLGRQLLCELADSRRAGKVHGHNVPPQVDQMTRFIASHLHQPLSLRDLVAFTQLSPATVGRLFREHLNTTPVRWIRNVRMERAKTLLRTRRLSVAQVGEWVGMSDPFYFSKCFKAQTGRSPTEYRRHAGWI